MVIKLLSCPERKIGIFLACLIILIYGCSDDLQIKEPPEVISVTPSSFRPGELITIEGNNFDTDPGSNVVAFSSCGFCNLHSSRKAVPVSGSVNSLSVVVPDGIFIGEVRVEWENPAGRANIFGLETPPLASNRIPYSTGMDPGDVAKVFFTGSEYDFTIAAGASDEEYLVIIFNSSTPSSPDDRWDYHFSSEYTCTGSAGQIYAAGYGGDHGAGGDRPDDRLSRSGLFERRRREELLSLLGGGADGVGRVPETGSRKLISPLPKGDGTVAAPQQRDFNVYADIEGSTIDPSSFTTVTADLKYEGDHTLLYVDQATDASCITDGEAFILGETFENNIYHTNSGAFGQESDINGDEKVAILLSPVINMLTPPGTASTEGYIAGFFLSGDLLPGLLNPSCTNGMEIFYTMVPDPDGLYGNTYEKVRALEVLEGVLAHEFLHMIMFNYRVLTYGSGTSAAFLEKLWIEEGLAHIAEDLNGHDESNILRAELFLADPGDVTLIHGGDELDERGASFLFLRYIGDIQGEQVFRDLVQSQVTGIENIERATGNAFFESFADWSATLYLDGRSITSDERFAYTSIDLMGNFQPLMINQFDYCTHSTHADSVNSMGPEYLYLSVASGSSVDFRLESAGGGRMNAVIIRTD